MEPADAAGKTVFPAAGLTQLATLTYHGASASRDGPGICFAGGVHVALMTIAHTLYREAIERSYEGTQDCPALRGSGISTTSSRAIRPWGPLIRIYGSAVARGASPWDVFFVRDTRAAGVWNCLSGVNARRPWAGLWANSHAAGAAVARAGRSIWPRWPWMRPMGRRSAVFAVRIYERVRSVWRWCGVDLARDWARGAQCVWQCAGGTSGCGAGVVSRGFLDRRC